MDMTNVIDSNYWLYLYNNESKCIY